MCIGIILCVVSNCAAFWCWRWPGPGEALSSQSLFSFFLPMSYRDGQERLASRRELPSDISDDEFIVDSIGEPDDVHEVDEPDSHTSVSAAMAAAAAAAAAVASGGTPASGFGVPLNQV